MKSAINITKINESNEDKPMKGGYFMVKKSLYNVHELKNGEEKNYNQELASKEKKVEGKKS